MNIVDKFSDNSVKILKTPVELTQTIANHSAQNVLGRYDERISFYVRMLEKYKSTQFNTMSASKPTRPGTDSAAIIHFNRDMRFSIKE